MARHVHPPFCRYKTAQNRSHKSYLRGCVLFFAPINSLRISSYCSRLMSLRYLFLICLRPFPLHYYSTFQDGLLDAKQVLRANLKYYRQLHQCRGYQNPRQFAGCAETRHRNVQHEAGAHVYQTCDHHPEVPVYRGQRCWPEEKAVCRYHRRGPFLHCW